jgi:cytochrome-b5 reductase
MLKTSRFASRLFTTVAAPTQAAAPKGNNTTLAAILGAASLATAGAYYFYCPYSSGSSSIPALTKETKNEFIPFKLSAVEELTPNTKKFTFELPSAYHTLGLSVSSLVLCKLPDAATGKDVIRPYTPVSTCDKRGSFDMIIKIYEKVLLSNLDI